MNDLQKINDEKTVLRWGGLAGMLGGIVTILMMVTLLVLVPDPVASPKELLMRFPDDRATIYLGESLYLVALILSVTSSLPCIGLSGGRVSRPLSSGPDWPFWVSQCSVPELFLMSLSLRSLTSIMLLGLPTGSRRHSSPCGKRPRVYSMRRTP